MKDHLKNSISIVNYAGIAAVSLLLAGTAAFGVYPLLERGSADIRAAGDLRNSLTHFGGLNQALASAGKGLDDTENRLSTQEQRIPSSFEASAFNAELTDVAKKAGIRIESMPNQQTFSDEAGYKALPVTVIGSGDWESCYRFLTGIKNMNRLTQLDSVIINVPDKDADALPPETPMCQITVRFSTFFLER